RKSSSRFLRLAVLSHTLDRCNDVRVRAAATDIAAHKFLQLRVVWSARFFQQRHRGHDLNFLRNLRRVSTFPKECPVSSSCAWSRSGERLCSDSPSILLSSLALKQPARKKENLSAKIFHKYSLRTTCPVPWWR